MLSQGYLKPRRTQQLKKDKKILNAVDLSWCHSNYLVAPFGAIYKTALWTCAVNYSYTCSISPHAMFFHPMIWPCFTGDLHYILYLKFTKQYTHFQASSSHKCLETIICIILLQPGILQLCPTGSLLKAVGSLLKKCIFGGRGVFNQWLIIKS